MHKSHRSLLLLIGATALSFGQYKAEVGGAPPPDAAARYQEIPFHAQSVKVVNDKGNLYCEVWLRASEPPAGKSVEQNVTLPEIPHGSLLGLIAFPADSEDRRGQKIKAGTYTLRYGNFPINGDHQGAAPQRDFFVLSKVADDPTSAPVPKFDDLINLSKKASGTPHPLVMSIWKADAPKDGFAREGENDWVLQKSIGKLPFAIILIGKADG